METILRSKVHLPYLAVIITSYGVERVIIGGDDEKARAKSISLLQRINPYLSDMESAFARKRARRGEANDGCKD